MFARVYFAARTSVFTCTRNIIRNFLECTSKQYRSFFCRPEISLAIKIVTSIDVSPCFHGGNLTLRALVLLWSR
jgi:hypothetical protein